MIYNTTSNKLAQTTDTIEHSCVLNELKTIARWMPYRLSSDEKNTGSHEVKLKLSALMTGTSSILTMLLSGELLRKLLMLALSLMLTG